jgi:histidinol-phosphate/aromatic aminotransferase/cobyric acid decarboxylase-like protein
MHTDLYSGGDYAELVANRKGLESDLAIRFEIDQDRVFLSNGSIGALRLIITLIACERAQATKPPCCLIDLPNYFDTLRFIDCAGYERLGITRKNLGEFPTDGMLKGLGTVPDLMLLTTPNNPLGQPIPDECLCRLLEALPEGCVALVDRTCLNTEEEIPTSELLARFKGRDIVVLHSFSKSHGCSAIRAGYYVCASERLAHRLRRYDDPGQVSLLAMQELRKRLEDFALPKRKCADLKESMNLLRRHSPRIAGFDVTPSVSNFCLVTMSPRLAEVIRGDYRIPDASVFGIANHGMYRLALDEPGKIHRFLEDCSRSAAR